LIVAVVIALRTSSNPAVRERLFEGKRAEGLAIQRELAPIRSRSSDTVKA